MLLIERTPTASSGCRSHAGDGPTFTPRTTAAWKRAQPSGSSIATRSGPVTASRTAEARWTGGTSGARASPTELRKAIRNIERGRELPRDALVPEEVGPVGRDVDHEPVIVEGECLEEWRPRGRVGVELPESVGIRAHAKLAR